MGNGYEVRCDSCGFTETFFLGIGMMDGAPGNHEKIIRSVVTKRGKKYLEKPGYKIFTEFNRGLYECPSCNTLHFRYDYEIQSEGEPPFKPTFKCGNCQKELIPATKDFGEYNCRKCYKGKLLNAGGILWD